MLEKTLVCMFSQIQHIYKEWSASEIVNKSGESRLASTPYFHSRHHLYHSKRVNPPEVTINNELKRANAMYIG